MGCFQMFRRFHGVVHFSDDCQLDFTTVQVCTAVRTRLSHRLIEFQVDLPMGCFQLLRWSHSYVHLSDNFQMEFTKGKVEPALRTQLTHLLTDFQVDLQRGCFHFSVQCGFSNGYIIQDTFRWFQGAVQFSDDFQMDFTKSNVHTAHAGYSLCK